MIFSEFVSVARAARAARAFAGNIQVEYWITAVGTWETSSGEPVFFRYSGAEINLLQNKWATVTVDGEKIRIRPIDGTIQFHM